MERSLREQTRVGKGGATRRQRARYRVVSAIERDAGRAGFALTSEQRAVMPELLAVVDALGQPAPDAVAEPGPGRPRGLYLWGAAGRGKSWLMDAFFRALPVRATSRVHFHGFLDAMQRRIHEHRGEPDAAQRALSELTRDARVVYFDEFFVHDSGDAVLLTRLLEHLADRGTVLLATSNHPPHELMAHSPWRHVFEHALELLDASAKVVRMGGDEDLRARLRVGRPALDGPLRDRGAAFGRGSWIVAGSGMELPEPAEATTLTVGDREFAALAVRGDHLWIGFDQLCVVPTSPIEYLAWAERFRGWTIVGVPSFEGVDAEAQQRFLTVIDVLSDAGVPTSVVSALTCHEFAATARSRPDAGRMLSRLSLLRDPAAS